LESIRYVDERTFDDLSVEQFTTEMDDFVAAGSALVRRVQNLEPGHDDANARLLPFIAAHSLSSDMAAIYDEVHRTGEQRYAHEVPPGFGDGGTKAANDSEDDDNGASQQKGKKRNRFGDLIMWLEALQDCRAAACEHLVILTRDNTKKDWVYNPERVLDDDGRPQLNSGLVTLPLPLLAQEARMRCPSLQSVHVISLEMFTQVVRTGLGGRVSNLIRALQSGGNARRPQRPGERAERPLADLAVPVNVTFGSADMMFEIPDDPSAGPIWRALADLKAEGWTAQNEAASTLAPLLLQMLPDQAKQMGRGVVFATNEGAFGPRELVEEILNGSSVGASFRANLLVGMLGEAYFEENGEPKKPIVHPDVTALLYDHATDADTRRAYEVAVAVPLEPFRRLYLALPGEEERSLRVELQYVGNVLQGLQVEQRELLEADAPPSRQLLTGGRAGRMSVTELLRAVAHQFVVPVRMLEVDGPTNFEVEIPDRMGFVEWGPDTGEHLR
jgi:hypothetical protein